MWNIFSVPLSFHYFVTLSHSDSMKNDMQVQYWVPSCIGWGRGKVLKMQNSKNGPILQIDPTQRLKQHYVVTIGDGVSNAVSGLPYSRWWSHWSTLL